MRGNVPHPADDHPSVRTWTRQVGALRATGNAGARRGLPRYWCWFQLVEATSHRVEPAHLAMRSSRLLRARVKAQRTSRTPSRSRRLASRGVRSSWRPWPTGKRATTCVSAWRPPYSTKIRAPHGSVGWIDALRSGEHDPVAAGPSPRPGSRGRYAGQHRRPARPTGQRPARAAQPPPSHGRPARAHAERPGEQRRSRQRDEPLSRHWVTGRRQAAPSSSPARRAPARGSPRCPTTSAPPDRARCLWTRGLLVV